jgi:hypothetical protein
MQSGAVDEAWVSAFSDSPKGGVPRPTRSASLVTRTATSGCAAERRTPNAKRQHDLLLAGIRDHAEFRHPSRFQHSTPGGQAIRFSPTKKIGKSGP